MTQTTKKKIKNEILVIISHNSKCKRGKIPFGEIKIHIVSFSIKIKQKIKLKNKNTS